MTGADTALSDAVHAEGIMGSCMAAFVLEASMSFRIQKKSLQNFSVLETVSVSLWPFT